MSTFYDSFGNIIEDGDFVFSTNKYSIHIYKIYQLDTPYSKAFILEIDKTKEDNGIVYGIVRLKKTRILIADYLKFTAPQDQLDALSYYANNATGIEIPLRETSLTKLGCSRIDNPHTGYYLRVK